MNFDGWTFEKVVCMYINDCLEYLRTGGPVVEQGFVKGEFSPTEDHDRIIHGLAELKRECMKAAGVDIQSMDELIQYITENPDRVRFIKPEDN